MWPEEKYALQYLSAIVGKCLAEGEIAPGVVILPHEAKQIPYFTDHKAHPSIRRTVNKLLFD